MNENKKLNVQVKELKGKISEQNDKQILDMLLAYAKVHPELMEQFEASKKGENFNVNQ
jgi:hypothetical protein